MVPEGYEHDLNALAKATLILIKLRPEEIKSGTNKNWAHDGIVAYSKICTHVGCPAALYEQTTHHILCPCHQSTFDAADGAKVIFGPAARPLPQLPIAVDGEGYLVATATSPCPSAPASGSAATPRPRSVPTEATHEHRSPEAHRGSSNFIDDRIGAGNFLKRNLRKVFPDHWSFLLGEIALYSFIILLLTGTFLTFFFKPSMDDSSTTAPTSRSRASRCPRRTPRRCTSASTSAAAC